MLTPTSTGPCARGFLPDGRREAPLDNNAPSAFAYLAGKAATWLKMPAGIYRRQDPLKLADEDCPEDTLRPLMTQLAQGIGASESQPLQADSVEGVYQALLTLHLVPQSVRSSLRATTALDRLECRHAVISMEIAVFAEIPLAED
ncbi:MAG: hypothetical protein K0Q68_313 [Moraxellaceae bacterium]|jgi:hypothetical protein|nr:hypothetical protein [Moraxellaceae bacterium]